MTAHISRMLIAGMLIGGVVHGPVLADPLPIELDVTTPDAIAGAVVQQHGSQSDPIAGNETVAPLGLFGDVAVNGDALDSFRGGAQISVLNDNYLNGVVSDNQAYNLVTGSNLVTEGSFAGANGLSTVIQNSGNNVLIQNSTIVNLQVQ